MHVFQAGKRFAFDEWIPHHYAHFILPALDALGLVAKKTALHLPTHHRAREPALEGVGTEGGAHFLLGALEGVVDVEQARPGFQLGLDLAGDLAEHRGGFERGIKRGHGKLDGNGITCAAYHRARGHFLRAFDEADVFAPFTGKITCLEIQVAGIMKMNAIFRRHNLVLSTLMIMSLPLHLKPTRLMYHQILFDICLQILLF